MTTKTAEPETGKTLVSKIAEVADIIGEKEPQEHRNRRGDGGVKFPYHAAKDVYGWWRKPLQERHLLLIPSKVMDLTVIKAELPRASGGTRVTFLTTCVVEFTIRDGVTGEWLTGIGIGQGEDPADKGVGKAMTYAEKNFLLGMGMNGSEPDVEAYDSEQDDRERSARRGRDVDISGSSITGIQRGGRSSNANDAQVSKVRDKARERSITIRGIAEFIFIALAKVVELPEDAQLAGPAMVAFLDTLTADEIGLVLQEMDKVKPADRAEDTRDDTRDEEYADGYGS